MNWSNLGGLRRINESLLAGWIISMLIMMLVWIVSLFVLLSISWVWLPLICHLCLTLQKVGISWVLLSIKYQWFTPGTIPGTAEGIPRLWIRNRVFLQPWNQRVLMSCSRHKMSFKALGRSSLLVPCSPCHSRAHPIRSSSGVCTWFCLNHCLVFFNAFIICGFCICLLTQPWTRSELYIYHVILCCNRRLQLTIDSACSAFPSCIVLHSQSNLIQVTRIHASCFWPSIFPRPVFPICL